jgi:hypothetical protein
VTRDWFIKEKKVLANNRILSIADLSGFLGKSGLRGQFRRDLDTSEDGTLSDKIEAVKGRFLRQLNNTLGGSLFDVLEDLSRAQGLPLLKLDSYDIHDTG